MKATHSPQKKILQRGPKTKKLQRRAKARGNKIKKNIHRTARN